MATKYIIPTNLYEKALAEMTLNHRRRSPSRHITDAMIRTGVKEVLDFSLGSVARLHENYLDSRRAPSVSESSTRTVTSNFSDEAQRRMREFREKRQREQVDFRDRMVQMLLDSHRSGLIKLLTLDGGISRATAEEIVDKHILIHK